VEAEAPAANAAFTEVPEEGLELLKAGRSVTEVAADLGLSTQTVYNWRRQEQIDSGLRPGVSSTDHVELIAARRRIAQLESELAVARRSAELLREAVPPKGALRRSR